MLRGRCRASSTGARDRMWFGSGGSRVMKVAIRSITRGDAPRWEALRCALWPGYDAEYREEIAAFFAGTLPEAEAVLLAEEEGGRIVAMAELSVRSDLPELGRRV